MKIYLLSEGGWELFDVERESEELKNRHISIGEGASIGEWASIGARASIGDGASIGAWASIGARAKFVRSPLYIIGTRDIFSQYDDDKIEIGCHVKPIDEWLSNYKVIGKQEGYTKSEIEEYGLYLKLAKRLMK